MALNETQLAGLKKTATVITEDDLVRVFTRLGLRKARSEDPGALLFTMAITADWQANATAVEIPSDTQKTTYRVDFFVTKTATGERMGSVHRTEDVNVFQLRGARIMSEMFESVDDLAPFTCAECGDGLLTWDGNRGRGTIKPGMRCNNCGWKGHTGAFMPFRIMR